MLRTFLDDGLPWDVRQANPREAEPFGEGVRASRALRRQQGEVQLRRRGQERGRSPCAG